MLAQVWSREVGRAAGPENKGQQVHSRLGIWVTWTRDIKLEKDQKGRLIVEIITYLYKCVVQFVFMCFTFTTKKIWGMQDKECVYSRQKEDGFCFSQSTRLWQK